MALGIERLGRRPLSSLALPSGEDARSGFRQEGGSVKARGPRGIKIACRNLTVRYGSRPALRQIDLDIPAGQVTALIGPSGAGKSSLLRCLNRMNDEITDCVVTGCVEVDGCNIYAPAHDPVSSRAQMGMILQRPNPYPKSIYDNVAYGLRIHGKVGSRAEEFNLVEKYLRQVGLWDEVSRRLDSRAASLSLGQQQKLCLARVLAIDPDVLLLDEPCASLDPVSTAELEALLEALGSRCTVVLVTQSLQQAARISKTTAFIQEGRLIEWGTTAQMFTAPIHPLTERYITGRDTAGLWGMVG